MDWNKDKPKKRMSRFGVNQRVTLKHSHTMCKTGKITEIEVRYIVKQDEGPAFWEDENNLVRVSE